ncbi:NTP transferase domain-containing protein [Candidatus Bathyarchaeota archaeon]|nr:NTP transferase domain-containing protein [Candidatus Bathyarchaeota archaeon]
MKAVVLAAGEGIRLRPLTLNKPKHLLPVGGKPLLEHLLLSIKAAGLNEALIVVHYLADQIKQYFGDGSKIGMKLEYAFQKEVLGTADATILAKPYVKKDFLLVYGDLLITSNTVKLILQSHKKLKSSVSMAVVYVKHPERYGVVKLTDSYVTDIIEKPRSGTVSTHIANAGIYAFSTNIFEKITQTQMSPRGEREITDSLRLLIQDQQSISAVQIPREEWHDVGRPWDLLEANKKALSQIKSKVVGQIEDGAHIIGPVEVAEGTRVRSGAYIEGPVFIDEESDIGPNCFIRPYTSIGKEVRVGNACEIKNSILMDKTRVGHLSYVGDSVIGEDCNLGAGTITANYRLDGKTIKMSVKDEIVDSERSKLGVIIGDQVKTGINALLMPGVKIGSKSWIGPNVVVDEDVSSNDFLLLKQSLK